MWFNLAEAARQFISLGGVPSADDMQLPIAIFSDEDYRRALERVIELESQRSTRAIETELAALAEAMLRWEMRRDERDDLGD